MPRFMPLPRPMVIALLAGLISTSTGFSQNNSNNNNNNNNNNASGILIDAAGTVLPGFTADQSSKLNRRMLKAAAELRLPADLMAPSDCRLISLSRLEKALGGSPGEINLLTDELRGLAGVQRIDFIHIDPDNHDVLIAGPAEPFTADQTGRLRGIENGRPTLLLDDLLIAFRAVPRQREIGCSIDPKPENLAALQRYLSANSTPASATIVEGRFRQMAEVLGLHDVRFMGVAAETHFARTLLEADYRMKRISMGLEVPGIKGLRSHLSLLKGGGNSIQRWWFVPFYDNLYCDADRLTFELTGQRVQVLSQEELVDGQGGRHAAATTRLTTQAFAKSFTDLYPKLAEQSPIFAELQNLTDLCVLVALLHQEAAFEKTGWSPSAFMNETILITQRLEVPQQVGALVNYKRASTGSIIGLIGGGVTIHPEIEVRGSRWQTKPERRLTAIRQDVFSRRPDAENRWWWDTK